MKWTEQKIFMFFEFVFLSHYVKAWIVVVFVCCCFFVSIWVKSSEAVGLKDNEMGE